MHTYQWPTGVTGTFIQLISLFQKGKCRRRNSYTMGSQHCVSEQCWQLKFDFLVLLLSFVISKLVTRPSLVGGVTSWLIPDLVESKTCVSWLFVSALQTMPRTTNTWSNILSFSPFVMIMKIKQISFFVDSPAYLVLFSFKSSRERQRLLFG